MAGDGRHTGEGARMTESAHEQVPVALRRLAASAVASEALTVDGLRQRFGDPQGLEVAVGQLWRASWDDLTILALLVGVHPAAVTIVPVTVDPAGEDENSLILDAKSTVLGQPVTAWAGLTRRLPLRVLDQLLDVVSDEIVAWCQRIQADRPATLPGGTRLGDRISSPLEPAAEVRAQIEDELELLAAVTGPPGEVLLASVQPLPDELVAELDHPRWRPAVRRRADRAGRNETHARLEIAYGTYAFAARQTGAATTPSWRERLARYLEAEGDREESGL